MSLKKKRDITSVVAAIRHSGLTIYDAVDNQSDLYLQTDELQDHLTGSLAGLNLNYALRTRSKVLKSKVCEVLGYPVPSTFRKTKPRFLGQNFDTYVQKANNLQIWNEEITPSRRYVVIRVDDRQVVKAIRVVSGEALALMDTTGTLTQKYQAKSIDPVTGSVLVSLKDTASVAALLA